MINHSNQLILNPIDNLELIKPHFQVDLLDSNQVSISGVLVVESLEVEDEDRGEFVDFHDLVGHLVVLALAAVPHVVLGQALGEAEVF